MRTAEKPTYCMSLRKRKGGWEILYNVGSEGKLTTILRLNGGSADKVFRGVIKALAKQGAAIPLKISDEEEIYAIREDLGPVIGSYLILVRRAKNLEKWEKFLNELLSEHYVGMAKAFSMFLELAIELSKSMPRRRQSKRYALSPVVVDALSKSLKHFVDKIAESYLI